MGRLLTFQASLSLPRHGRSGSGRQSERTGDEKRKTYMNGLESEVKHTEFENEGGWKYRKYWYVSLVTRKSVCRLHT